MNRLWIQPAHSRRPQPLSAATHLEINLDTVFFRCLQLARAWFDVCPEHLLEIQSFVVEVNLLEQTNGETKFEGEFAERPINLEILDKDVAYAYLHVTRLGAWLEVCTTQDEALETNPCLHKNVPLLSVDVPQPDEVESSSQVTLALKMQIQHIGIFTEKALEELLNNLDFALNQQRDTASLSPESLDGVTQDFSFHLLDLRQEGQRQ
jgi:hypothetical protein